MEKKDIPVEGPEKEQKQGAEEQTNIIDETESLENENFDVFLGCRARVRGNPVIGGKFIRAYKSNSTSFYIVKKNIVEGLISSNKQSIRTMRRNVKDKKDGIPIDVMWFNLMNIFFFIVPIKILGSQLEGYSDILNKNKNYSNILGIKIEQKLESKPSEPTQIISEESKPNLPALPELPKLELENFKDSEKINPSNDIQNP
jgi:hypothetical protein